MRLKEEKADTKEAVKGTGNNNPPGFATHNYIWDNYQKGQAIKKFNASITYNFFLTTVEASENTHNEDLSIRILVILDSSLGELESSVQINDTPRSCSSFTPASL